MYLFLHERKGRKNEISSLLLVFGRKRRDEEMVEKSIEIDRNREQTNVSNTSFTSHFLTRIFEPIFILVKE